MSPFTMRRHLLLLAALLPAGSLLLSCNDPGSPVVARQISDTNDLIGGPAAKGKVGDYLLENDQLRAIVAGDGQSWLGNTFGGSLVDIDRVRPQRRELAQARGFDSFGETFPLANLIIPDPAKPIRRLETAEGSVELTLHQGSISVLHDGSDGKIAAIRIRGAGAYLFQAVKFLNKDFLRAMLDDFQVMGQPLRNLLKNLVDPNLDVYSLLNRLQLDFNFTTDYIVKAGEPYITIRTELELAPPGDAALSRCPELEGCRLEACPHGLALQQVSVAGDAGDEPLLCPACACALPGEPMAPFTEQRAIFSDMLGDLDQWVQPGWRGGILGGDFLFFGGKTDIFLPGQGFDDDRRVYENMWQGVGSLGSPFVYPWLAATGENVSYGFTTVNPGTQQPASCPTHRPAVLQVTDSGEQALAAALQQGFGLTEGAATGLVRGNLVDRTPILLPVPSLPTDTAAAVADLEGWRSQAVGVWWNDAVASWAGEGEGRPIPALPHLEPEALQQVQQAFEQHATLGLVPAASCLPAQLMVPIFTTSATAVMSHEELGSLDVLDDGSERQSRTRFSWERYLVVGDGDVGSVLQTVHRLRHEPVGWVRGLVLEDSSGTPVSHAHVFAVRDPRTEGGEPGSFTTWTELNRAARQAFGNDGLASQMQTDVGLDDVRDGDYRGPLPPGRYLLVAKTADRRASRPVAVTVRPDRDEVVHLMLEPAGHLSLRVHDEAGQRLPAKAVLVDVDAAGKPLPWDGRGQASLGDSRYDLGVRRAEFAHDGTLELDAEPGTYGLYVSRGLEYSLYSSTIELKPGVPEFVEVQLVHEVDSSGHVSGDFHLHSAPSVDSGMPMADRVKAAAAEGVEFITATDHDQLTDYRPLIQELGLEPFLAAQVGVETSTLEFGHFNGFPLRYDRRDWSVHDPPPWFGLSTGEMFAGMKARATGDPDDFVLQVNHPWDGFMGYFAQAGVHGYDLQRSTPGMETCNPMTEEVSCDFNAVEIINERRFELIRTPTVEEVDRHNRCYREILATHTTLHFQLPTAEQRQAEDFDLALVVCGWLRLEGEECSLHEQELAGKDLAEAERQRLLDERDHCRWARQLEEGFARCAEPGIALITCKRAAIDALKHYSVRHMLERTPAEQEAFRTLTAATDPGCDLAVAQQGCTAQLDRQGKPKAGCEDCLCQPCVCAAHPACCEPPDAETGEGGWTEACATACREECSGCGQQPCTDRTQMLDAWFTMLNQGFEVTGMGNSDSHGRNKEIGLPRNYIRSSTQRLEALDPHELNQNIRRHRVTLSTGPFVEMKILGGTVGDTVRLPEGAGEVAVSLKIQTPSWFNVDRLELYRNGRLERRLRLEQPASALVDYEGVLRLPTPAEDSWYVAVVYGLEPESELSPVYNGLSFGQLLIPTLISIGLPQILGGFDSLMATLQAKGLGPLLETYLGQAVSSLELPDSFPTFPFAVTNPIRVDVDGGGYVAPEARLDAEGKVMLPPFCAQSCTVVADEEGQPTQSGCGVNQLCLPVEYNSEEGRCRIPVGESCPPDVFGTGGSLEPAALVQHATGTRLPGLQSASETPWSATRIVERLLRERFLRTGP